MINTVIFDLDDTLYNEREFVLGAFKEVAIYLSISYGIDYRDIIDYMEYILINQGRERIFNKVCEQYSMHEDIQKLVEIYRNAKPKLKLYEDAKLIIEWLNIKKYNTGIITDGISRVQWNKIRSLKIDKLMGKIVVSDDLGEDSWKPSTKPYEQILNYFRCKGNECIYIGDNPLKDFIGAKKMGFKTVRIRRKIGDNMKLIVDNDVEADYSINKLLDLKSIL